MKRLLFCIGALISSHCASGMEWGSKKGYEKIPSPEEERHNPYCYTDSCIRDEQRAEDLRTMQNLKDLERAHRGNIQDPEIVQSSVFIEVMLENNAGLMARDTKVCEISKDSNDTSSQPLSAPAQSNNQDSQKPAITIQHVALNTDSAIIEYCLNTGKERSTQIVSVRFDQPDKRPLDNGLIVTISALIASSGPNVTRK